MLFNSYVFVAVFLPLALAGFAAAGGIGRSTATGWLIAMSLLFLGWWKADFVVLLLISIVGNYLIAMAIWRAGPRVRTAILAAGITGNLAALIWFKYLAAIFGALRDLGLAIPAFADPVLPLGISFFTFTQIGFLLDCRDGTEARCGLLDYALFVTFFPHLIAGPVLNSRDILPQLDTPATWRLSPANIAVGLGFFLIGLLKKTMLADPLSAVAAPGFAAPEALTLLEAWRAALSWALQLYFDFSGYSDMAIGVARMFNIRFPVNFDSPYKAQSVIEYWQRWHMSLTRFLTGTLYTPLAMAVMRYRRGRGWRTDRTGQRTLGGFASMIALPTVVTMGLAGVWHGSGLTFLVFGLLHALFLGVNHAWRLFRRGPPSSRRVAIAGRVLLTFLCVLLGAIVFRAPTLGAAADLLVGMAGGHGIVLVPDDPGHAVLAIVWLGALFALVWAGPNSQQIMREAAAMSPAWMLWRPNLAWAVAFGCAATLGLMSIGGTGEFLYFQF